jgi:hypothetical protein
MRIKKETRDGLEITACLTPIASALLPLKA